MTQNFCHCARKCRGLIRRSSRTIRRHLQQDRKKPTVDNTEDATTGSLYGEDNTEHASAASSAVHSQHGSESEQEDGRHEENYEVGAYYTKPEDDTSVRSDGSSASHTDAYESGVHTKLDWTGVSVDFSRQGTLQRKRASTYSSEPGRAEKRRRITHTPPAQHPAVLIRRSTLRQFGSLNSDAFEGIYDEIFEVHSQPSFDSVAPGSSSTPRSVPSTILEASDSDDDELPEPLLDFVNDPLYLDLAQFNEALLGEDGSIPEPSVNSMDEETDHPPAFEENPVIRNAYIRAFVNSAFKAATHEQTHDFLDAIHSTMQSLARQTDGLDLDDDLTSMARTLRTVEKRLGVDPDDSIIYYFLCPVCWARHHPTELSELANSACTRQGCSGELYTIRQTPSGVEKRTPNLICPYHPIRDALRRLLLRPGIPEALQHWRGPGDEPGDAPPISKEEWSESVDPSLPMHDIYDGWMWRSLRAFCERTWDRRRRLVLDIEPANRTAQRFVSLKFGLVIHINIDWFQSTRRRVHSSGAIFATVDNLPRGIRYLRENTFLVCMIPGPHEPTTEQLNELVSLIVDELSGLYKGEMYSVYGYADLQKIYATLPFLAADTPARLKTGGYTAQNSESSPSLCTVCKQPFASLIHINCFDRTTFELRDAMKDLHYKFKAALHPHDADEIANTRGVRYTPLDSLPNWNIPQSLPPEPMHMFFPGKAAHIHKNILLKFGMFTGASRGGDTPLDKLETFLSDILWPATSGRVNSKIASGSGKPKADEWRNLMTVYPVALAVAWGLFDADDDRQAPHARRNTRMHTAAMRVQDMLRKRRERYQNHADNTEAEDPAPDGEPDRNYLHHYINVLRFCAALRIFASRSISPIEAERAQKFFSQAAQSWAAMDCHLTPNFHVSMHILEFVYLLGSIYGFWVFAYERFMGILSSFRTNGRSGGEMEATLMRAWWKTLRCQELMRHMEQLPNKTPEDVATINLLTQAMKGGAEGDRQRGTLMNYLAALAAEDPHAQVTAHTGIKLPHRSTLMDTRKEGLYAKILLAVRAQHPNLRIASDAGASDANATHVYYSHRSSKHATVGVNGVKYGSGTHAHGAGCSLAFVRGRNAAHIHHLLTLSLTSVDPDGQDETAHVAVIQRFVAAPSVVQENVPWQGWDTDLGIALWNINEMCELEIVDMYELSGLFALAPLNIRQEDFWISFSMDHHNSEPDIEEGPHYTEE